MKELMRLDKYLAEMGQGTRSQIKEMARKGRITVNSVTEKKSDRKISPLPMRSPWMGGSWPMQSTNITCSINRRALSPQRKTDGTGRFWI